MKFRSSWFFEHPFSVGIYELKGSHWASRLSRYSESSKELTTAGRWNSAGFVRSAIEHFSGSKETEKCRSAADANGESRASAKWHERCGRRPLPGFLFHFEEASSSDSFPRLVASLASGWNDYARSPMGTPLNAGYQTAIYSGSVVPPDFVPN